MKKNLLALAVCGMIQTAGASTGATFFDSISQGDADISFRYRYEFVDQYGFNKDANAPTLRTRLNYKTKAYNGFSFFIEADNITEVFDDNYNAGAGNSPGNTQYPVVADPQGTEINQVWFNYAFNENAGIKVGRQRINLDNQRFVGGVGWRQNEQTYDAVSGSFDISGSKLFISYVDNVNRIFGEDVAAGDHDNSTILANWSNNFANFGKLSVYYYDINNKDVAAFSTSTFGAKLSGNIEKFNYGIEFASQNGAYNNPVNYTANYYRLDAGYKLNKATLYAGYEVLEGDAKNTGSMFRTPLATLHAFNGWADKFLGTPQEGLQDLFIGAKGKINGYKWNALYHDFSAQDSGRDFGSEFNISIAHKVNKHVSLLLKGAFYKADTYGTDTSKVWFMVTSNF
ncbi:MAG: alginate export family protein [Proteobacteria bacterium]|nr:alginate export family protein [Pseudomonadota bacterium]